MSEAETLGQLKNDLNTANIDYAGLTFFEGLSKTELKSDDSILPKDVPYTNRTTGETKNTNELVFLLTNGEKKIASGADRKELMAYIKANHLEDECKTQYGKNYTNCSNDQLEHLIDAVKASLMDDESTPFTRLIDVLYKNSIISDDDIKYINNVKSTEITSPYSDNDIKYINNVKPTEITSPYSDDDIEALLYNC